MLQHLFSLALQNEKSDSMAISVGLTTTCFCWSSTIDNSTRLNMSSWHNTSCCMDPIYGFETHSFVCLRFSAVRFIKGFRENPSTAILVSEWLSNLVGRLRQTLDMHPSHTTNTLSIQKNCAGVCEPVWDWTACWIFGVRRLQNSRWVFQVLRACNWNGFVDNFL